MSTVPEDAIKDIIDRHDSFLITSHVYPDGDALGGELALMYALEGMGKRPVVINADGVPAMYDFLPGADRVKVYPDGADGKYDAAFVLDAGTLKRIRGVRDLLREGMPVVNIDHHESNTGFGTMQLVDMGASATAEILYRLFERWHVPVTPEMAMNLYAGMATDTGRFSFSNTGAETFRIAAELVEKGADVNIVFRKVYQERTVGQLRLMERALSSLEVSGDGRFAWISLRRADFEETGTAPIDTEEFAEMPRSIKGVEVALFFREEGEKNQKGSLRSNGPFNASRFAAHFGGGGHAQAAGYTLMESLSEARRRVLGELMENFDEYVDEA